MKTKHEDIARTAQKKAQQYIVVPQPKLKRDDKGRFIGGIGADANKIFITAIAVIMSFTIVVLAIFTYPHLKAISNSELQELLSGSEYSSCVANKLAQFRPDYKIARMEYNLAEKRCENESKEGLLQRMEILNSYIDKDKTH